MSENSFDRKLEGMRQLVEANSLGLAQLRDLQENSQRQNDQKFAQLREIQENSQRQNDQKFAELREGQAMLVQIFSQQQDSFQEFRRITKATLDRMELNQEQTNRELAAHRQEILSLQRQVLTLQQNQTGIQTEIRRILDIILEPEQE